MTYTASDVDQMRHHVASIAKYQRGRFATWELVEHMLQSYLIAQVAPKELLVLHRRYAEANSGGDDE